MSLCVPEWDSTGFTQEDGFVELAEREGEYARCKRSHLSHLAIVPDQHRSSRTANGYVDMQGQNSRSSKSQWQANYSSNWTNGEQREGGVTPSKPPTSKDNGPEAAATSTPVEASSVPPVNSQDDEMVSWLQYPLDDTLEKDYCSDFFGELRSTDMQELRETFGNQGAAKAQRMPHQNSAGNDAIANRAATAETAMMLGAGRAAGLLPQAGVEAFSKVRTLQPAQSPPLAKWQHSSPVSSKGLALYPTSGFGPARVLSNSMLPPKSQPVAAADSPSVHPPKFPSPKNFFHFSRPAAMMKANLHSLAGISLAPSQNVRMRPQVGKAIVEASASTDSSIAESTTPGRSKLESAKDVQLPPSTAEGQQQSVFGESAWLADPNSAPSKESKEVTEDPAKGKNKAVDQDTCHLSGVTAVAVPESSERAGTQRVHFDAVQEPTITSSSGGSGSNAQRAKEVATSSKRKSRDNDDTDCHSEDGEEESVDLKKPLPARGSTAKRSRAAEVHNLSERRRRDRINEKMKALQELIPNSNKTDKASMLDEAIEYLKMLQLQLQMMSMRSGLSLPPTVMPPGLQHHMQMSQMAAMPTMAMGMVGMPMGLGMGMIDMGAPAPSRPLGPLAPHAGPSNDSSVSNSGNTVDVHDPRLHMSSVVDSMNACLPHQHQQVQIPQVMNMDMYNAYLLQQHQHQHQHQHHHHHHQTPNMGWGPPQ